jgi:ACR3 family arsenite efflux pump ArsB
MNKLNKIALLNLCLATVGLFLQLLHLLVSDLPIKLIASIIALILCCFLLASYLHRRKLAKQGGSQYDERDKSIHTRAALIGLMVAFLVFFSATLIAFLSVGPGGEVEIGSILGMFLLGAMSFFTTESAAVLVQYGAGGNDNE